MMNVGGQVITRTSTREFARVSRRRRSSLAQRALLAFLALAAANACAILVCGQAAALEAPVANEVTVTTSDTGLIASEVDENGLEYVYVTGNQTWESGDLKSKHYVLQNNATVTIAGMQYVFEKVVIEGEGTFKRAADYDGNLFRLGACDLDPSLFGNVTCTIEGDITIDGNSENAGVVERALINLQPTGYAYTLNIGGNVVLRNAKVNARYEGAAIWCRGEMDSTNRKYGSVTINLYGNAKIEGNDGVAVFCDSGANATSSLSLADKASISNNAGGGVHGFRTVAMSGDAKIQDNTVSALTGGGYGIDMSLASSATSLKLLGNACVAGNKAGGVKLAGGTMTMQDKATITNNSNAGNGGGILVTGGTVQLKGKSSIAGNTSAANGGGVALTGGTLMLLEEATVKNNTTTGTGNGGGIFATEAGSVRVSAGSITNNTSAGKGGGLYFATTGLVQLAGGSITANTSDGVGAGVYAGSSFYMQDAPRVTSNTAAETCGNLYLAKGMKLIVPQGKTLTGAAGSIGLLCESQGLWTQVATHQAAAEVFTTENRVFSYDAPSAGLAVFVDFVKDMHNGSPRNLVLYTAGEEPIITQHSWTQLAGNNRYLTMAAVVQAAYEQGETSDVAVLVTGAGFPDALAASALAGLFDAPIILTADKELDESAAGELVRLEAKTVYIVGGTGVVSQNVDLQVKRLSTRPETVRLWGADRDATARDILKSFSSSWSNTIIVANGYNFPDALSVAAYSYASKSPIVLTNSSGILSDETVKRVRELAPAQLLIVGGTGVVSDAVVAQVSAEKVCRLSGVNRYETSAAIVNWMCGDDTQAAFQPAVQFSHAAIAVATGGNFPDALAGGAFCGKANAPLLLIDESEAGRTGLAQVIGTREEPLYRAWFLGGDGVISPQLQQEVKDAILGI